jgi:hypothetical protein
MKPKSDESVSTEIGETQDASLAVLSLLVLRGCNAKLNALPIPSHEMSETRRAGFK